jgi:hypothetical protein
MNSLPKEGLFYEYWGFLGIGVFRHNPDFKHFVGIGGFRGFGSYSQNEKQRIIQKKTENHPHQPHLHHTIYPIRGGGDYRGIYDTGFKRGF